MAGIDENVGNRSEHTPGSFGHADFMDPGQLEPGLESPANWGPKKTKKKEVILSKNNDFDGWPILLDFFFFGCHFWKYKFPWGAAGDKSRVVENPDFTNKSRFENGLVVCFFKVFKVCGAKFQSCGINFSMRFQIE